MRPSYSKTETDEEFLRAIEAAGLHWTQGRVFHIMGKHDKGRAVHMLISLYQQQFGDVASIGLGDSLNDLAMLKAVDQAGAGQARGRQLRCAHLYSRTIEDATSRSRGLERGRAAPAGG